MLRRAAFSPNIKERADCSAALFTAERRAAGAGRAHPGAPRLDAGVGARRRSTRSATDAAGPGEQVILNDPFAGGTHLNDITLVAPCFVGGRAGRLGRQPGPPRRRRRRRARLDAGRRHRDLRRRACASRRSCSTTSVRRGAAGQLPHAGRARAATSTPRSAPTRSASSAWPALAGAPLAEVRRLRRAPHAGRAGRPARRHVAGRRRARLDRAGARPAAPGPRARWRVTVGGRRGHVRLHRHRPPARRQRQRGRGGHGQRRGRSPCGRAVDPTIPANGGAHAPGPGGRPAGHDRGGPPAGRGGRRQRRGQPAGRRRLPRRRWRCRAPDRVAGGGPGHDEQRARRRRRLGLLRDGRPAGRAAGPTAAGHERRPHRHDQHPQHADRGAGADVPAAGAALPPAPGERRRGPLRRAARASSATSRCSTTPPSR